MNQMRRYSILPWGLSILIGGVVIWGFQYSTGQQSRADDGPFNRRNDSPRSKAGSNLEGRVQTQSKTAISSGFHPEFSHRGQPNSANSTSSIRSSTPAAKASPGPRESNGGALRSPIESQTGQFIALSQKEKKERQPRVEQPKVQQPKVQQPQVQQPQIQQPRVQQPKFEQSQVQQPKVQQPQIQQPRIQQPRIQQPRVQQPKFEQSQVQQPKVQQPQIQQPRIQQPRVQQPKFEQSQVQKPKVQQPQIQQPRIQQPRVQQPKFEQSQVQQPKVQRPKVELPNIQTPKLDKSRLAQPKTEKSNIERSRIERSAGDKPIVVKPKSESVLPNTGKPTVVVPGADTTVTGKAPRLETGKGKIQIRKPETDRTQGAELANPGKIKIRQPNEKANTGVPNLDLSKGVGGKTDGRNPDGRNPDGRNPEKMKLNPSELNAGKLNPGKLNPNQGKPGKLDPEKTNTPKTITESEKKPPRLKDGQTLSREDVRKVKQELDLQQTKIKDGKPAERVKLNLNPEMKKVNAERLQKLPREQLKLPVAKNGKLDPVQIERLKLRPARDTFNDRIKSGDLNRYSKLKVGNTYQIQRQFALHQSGDISRRMNLLPALQARGGWRHRHFGLISPIYAQRCQGMWYSGPSFCSPYLWYPKWSPWVDWCWWDTCSPIYDPRPIFCRPVFYNPCSPWVAWQYPVWQPLPYVTCGSWVDVEPVVINTGDDLQLLATRFVDPGHPTQEIGPRFRVWFRNNSPFAVNRPFNVLLIASTEANAYAGLPEAGVQVPSMAPGEIQSVDIRLPFAANFLNRDSEGRAVPFSHLNVFVDSHNEIPEAFEANNGATLVRGDILPVDPVIFAAEPARVEPKGVVHLAGEGFGPEPGKAVVVIGDQEFDAEILGWFDLGVQIRIPDFDLTESTAADLVIVRGDGAASPPLTIEIDPSYVEPTVEQPAPESVSPEAVPPVVFGPEFPAPPPLPEAD